MLTLRKVAVTGGLSSGKSTVCRLFKQLGAFVVSADDIVHHLLSPETTLGQQVINLLGNEVVTNGKFDRKAIADRVFQNDQSLLHKLETLLHPAVDTEMKKQYTELLKNRNAPLYVAEIPLLFEAGYKEDWFDAIITVDAPEEMRRARFQSLGGSQEEYQRRMSRQLSPQIKALRSHYTIQNDGDLKQLQSHVSHLFHVLTQ